VSLTETSGRFITLPDEPTLAATVVALEEHGFSVEVVDDLDAARQAVLARIPILAAISAPTELAVSIAQASNLTLIALARGDSALVFNDPFSCIAK